MGDKSHAEPWGREIMAGPLDEVWWGEQEGTSWPIVLVFKRYQLLQL